MKRNIFLIASLLMSAMLFAACATQADASGESAKVEDLESFTGALRNAGATVESSETIQQDFFTVEGRVLKVNGVDVQVFEYESPEAMEAEAALVAPDGGSVGTSMMMWMAAPHFYKSGSLLVLYVGDDAETLDLLRSVVGEQFAGR